MTTSQPLYTRPSLTPSEFAANWSGSTATERAASQGHFIDLCRMLGVPTPNEADPHGEWYAFEKGAEKTGGDGFADVWKRHHVAWEYKGKQKDLGAAYQQLLQVHSHAMPHHRVTSQLATILEVLRLLA